MSWSSLRLVTPPIETPITLIEAKTHCRIDIDTEDTLVSSLITAATEYLQGFTGKQLCNATYEVTFPCFPDVFNAYNLYSDLQFLGRSDRQNTEIHLPHTPLSSLVSVAYVDVDGVTQSVNLADIETVKDDSRTSLYSAYNKSWPTTRYQHNAVTITYIAGYGSADNVPTLLKHALKLIVGHWFENRESVQAKQYHHVPMAAESIMRMYSNGQYR